ncbi:ABC transporter ATP-binding protein [Lacipirellula limnantheis]|uniref:Putative ABC transporter ATP-binding protein YlmA n=1 Tax=Lacipirellula limnantheis TaxID=2528024 RepID=A0A517TSM1_9BACT|nr:ATP-binding cassette domain-containing protein [Lacipirellula limnantheis]QDT71376.1 putative ABC transporter ATP-binding protein YlmA [Lacipirellula limnantheis]
MTAPIVELEHVGFRQQQTEILADVSWRLERRRHWAVLGPNGCGKTTMLRIACGYLWPTSGTVRRLGEELVDLGRLRRSIGWVAADLAPRIPADELAIETVVSGRLAQVGLRRLGELQPTEADFAAAGELLDAMRCGELAHKPFGVLSQGERQQMLVARARMVDPLLIVLDEPCAGMDPGVRERFLAWLEQLAGSPTSPSLILVTHHVEEIMPSFESTLVMDRGRIAGAGPTAEVVTAERLELLYGIGVQRLERSAGRLWPIWREA